jgi:hypothetical protein
MTYTKFISLQLKRGDVVEVRCGKMIKTMLKGFGVLCISVVLMTCVMVGIGELNAFFASQISDWMKMGVAGLMCLFIIAFVLYVLGSFVEES